MANKNGRKGSQFETDVMKWLRNAGAMAERLTKAGAKDEGDMVVIISGETYILELIAHGWFTFNYINFFLKFCDI